MVSVTLVKHLKSAGFHDLSQNASDGKYDQQKDASDEWALTPEGKKLTAMVKDNPELKTKMDEAMRAMGQAQKDGRIPRYVVPDDGPPEPGSKGLPTRTLARHSAQGGRRTTCDTRRTSPPPPLGFRP